ncbi:hypothetical protein ARMGADRAFT_1034186 [Armillaria gallica]|uniref:Uncharacterized protein n=1 Tax=Armillaria gallica TaxID=47427 RepID=A0A2H3D2B7_ARMGA|nr:hypothetical protein ARMGADRAFT_1034186 [Armillaria gallica]
MESILIGNCNNHSKDFILGKLSDVPRLQFINLNRDTDTGGKTRGCLIQGRGGRTRQEKAECLSPRLEDAAKKKGVLVELVSRDLEYKVEGAQRRAGFAAMGRGGYWWDE